MKSEKYLSISNGFLMVHREQKLPVSSAEKLLRSSRRYKYTRAIREGETVTLAKDLVKCPYCGWETPAYTQFLASSFTQVPWWQRPAIEKLPKKTINEWFDSQDSLFKPRQLSLNRLQYPTQGFKCPHCGKSSQAGNRENKVHFIMKKKTLTVSCEAFAFDELLNLGQRIDQKRDKVAFPLTESLVFNFSNGHTFFKISDGNDMLIAIYDLTDFNHAWIGFKLYEVLGCTAVLRKLYQFFQECYGQEIPFTKGECTVERLTALTRFQHYPKEFYDAIPYNMNTGYMARGFKGISKKLLHYEQLPELYKASSLPQMKSIRREFFSEPGLFFFLREVEDLWALMKDPNYFCRLLKHPFSYKQLSFLHQYPTSFSFLKDYREVKGVSALSRVLCESKRTYWENYAKHYCILNDSMKRSEQQLWKNRSTQNWVYSDRQFLSAPVFANNRRFQKRIGQYYFCQLTTTLEFKQAGKALHNCLGSALVIDEPQETYVVKKNNELKAAIELENTVDSSAHSSCIRIVEALAAHNKDLRTDPELYTTVKRWAKICGLEMPENI